MNYTRSLLVNAHHLITMTFKSEEALARKMKVRAGHRASTTRLLAQAEAAFTADPLTPAVSSQFAAETRGSDPVG